jgi:hypothetical protein
MINMRLIFFRCTLLYIEFIGHVVILIVIVVFTSVYWCIGLLVKYDILK